MIPSEIIKKKRDGKNLSREELEYFFSSYLNNEIPDYQVSSLLMAIFFNGLNIDETINFTKILLNSGEVIDLSYIDKPKIDKHSTGGVGDKISLILAPIVASLDICVPMISGRALGHTGGTLDKLESIPGFNVNLTIEQFKKQIETIGCALIGQTDTIVPLDKKLYALRDVTGTVENISLICGSILSKKAAEGIDGLVLDVKYGSGAFMKNLHDAKLLSKNLCFIGKKLGKKVVSVLSDMNQPLGKYVGNSLEVLESIEALKGNTEEDVNKITKLLASKMLLLGKKIKNEKEAYKLIENAISSGKALEKLKEIIIAQNGDPRIIDNYDFLPKAKKVFEVKSVKSGYIKKINTEAIGIGATILGAGRLKKEDNVDYSVGLEIIKKINHKVKKGEPIVIVHYNNDNKLEAVEKIIKEAYFLN
jgi:pyrimidine-nucleoside phosphorylase